MHEMREHLCAGVPGELYKACQASIAKWLLTLAPLLLLPLIPLPTSPLSGDADVCFSRGLTRYCLCLWVTGTGGEWAEPLPVGVQCWETTFSKGKGWGPQHFLTLGWGSAYPLSQGSFLEPGPWPLTGPPIPQSGILMAEEHWVLQGSQGRGLTTCPLSAQAAALLSRMSVFRLVSISSTPSAQWGLRQITSGKKKGHEALGAPGRWSLRNRPALTSADRVLSNPSLMSRINTC